MSDDVIKYFYEEPASFELLQPEGTERSRRSLEDFQSGPRYHRGYLAGTDLATGRVGLTAIAHPEAFIRPLLELFGGFQWQQIGVDGVIDDRPDVIHTLAFPDRTKFLSVAEGALPNSLFRDVAADNRPAQSPALPALMDAARVVLFPEPAHHGFDWSLFSATPLREALRAAFGRHPVPGVRRFGVPYQEARSEEKFYFESWALDALPDFIETWSP